MDNTFTPEERLAIYEKMLPFFEGDGKGKSLGFCSAMEDIIIPALMICMFLAFFGYLIVGRRNDKNGDL